MIETATYDYYAINTSKIFSDPAYQRPIDPKRVRSIAEHFNPMRVNAIKVSHRDGKYWVFDGQHTMKVLILRNGGDLNVECKVYEGLTQKEEAMLFARQNEFEKRVDKASEMKALYAAGDVEIVELKKAIEEVGFTFDFDNHKATNRIICCEKIYKIFRNCRVSDFAKFLRIIKDAWGGNSDSLRKEIIGGMWCFYNTYKTEIDLGLAAKKFQMVNPIEIIRDAKTLKAIPGDSKYAYVLATHYNKNLRKNKLDLSMLTQ